MTDTLDTAATSLATHEAEFVAQLKSGDRTAFERLVREFGPRMLAVVRRYLPVESDAEDALQDAFLSVWRSMHAFAGASRLSTWLHRIAVNAALLRIRTRSRRREVLTGDLVLDGPTHRALHLPVTHSVDELLSRDEVRKRVQSCVADLPEDIRAIVRLRMIDGLGLHEIGELLDLCRTTVKMRLHRGYAALHVRLSRSIGVAS